jgi:alkylation response protein AidB-like acyl-CoA dehydrogenase
MRTVASYAAMTTATEAVLPLVPTEEERQIRAAVRGICDGFPEDYSRSKHSAGEPPTELWDALAEKGYLGINLPEEWGGGGLGIAGLAAVGEEITASGKSLLLIVVSPAIVGNILARHGTDAQNERWLRGIAAGTTKVAFAITEPDAGTNSHNLATSLERRGDGFVLKGQKTYISGVEHADAVLVVARSKLPDGTLGLPSLAIVDVDAPGFTRDEIPMPYLGPDKQWTLFFDDVELEEERLIGGEGGGLGPVFDGLNPERIMGAAVGCGTGLRALAKASAYANERRVWNAPIGTHQGIAHPLAEAKVELELARLMMQKAAALYDAGAPGAGEASNMAKYAAAEAAIHCVDRAIQTHGGNGFALEYGLSDMWWGARLTRTAPVSREMILNYVAEHSLGLPKSY